MRNQKGGRLQSESFLCVFLQLFSELCIADPAVTSKAGVWSSPYAELNCKKSLFLGVPPSLVVLDVLGELQRPGLPCVWYLCKELGPGIAFGRSPGHGFQGFGSQGTLSGQTTAQPQGPVSKREGHSTGPATGSCTAGAVRGGELSMGRASDLVVLPGQQKRHRLVGEVGNCGSSGGLCSFSCRTEGPL